MAGTVPHPPVEGGPAAPAPPAQPQSGQPFADAGIPRGADGRIDTNRVFSDLTIVPNWQQNIDTWAAHPAAGSQMKFLKALKDRQNGGR